MSTNQVNKYFATSVSMLALAGNYTKEERHRKTGWLYQFKGRKKEEHIHSHCKIYDDIRNHKIK